MKCKHGLEIRVTDPQSGFNAQCPRCIYEKQSRVSAPLDPLDSSLEAVMSTIVSELGELTYEERRRVIEALEALYPPRGAILPPGVDVQEIIERRAEQAANLVGRVEGRVWCPTRQKLVNDCNLFGCVGAECKFKEGFASASKGVCERCGRNSVPVVWDNTTEEPGMFRCADCFGKGGI